MPTLNDHLRQENPTLNNKRCKSGNNTTCAKWNWKQPRKIVPWRDFDFDSMTQIYGGALSSALQCQQPHYNHPSVAEFPYCELTDEDSLEALVSVWNQAVVTHGLNTAQKDLNSSGGDDHIFMVRGGQAAYPNDDPAWRPDWAGVRRACLSLERRTSIIIGDTKLSSKWKSSQILTRSGEVLGDYTNLHLLR